MKRVLVLCPNVWDKEGLAHPKVRGRCEAILVGEELLANPSWWAIWTFDIFKYAHRLAEQARRARVEGVVGTGDYPGCMLAALVSEELGLPGPRVRDVVRLSHKFYSREIQRSAAPEGTPGFWALDPYARRPQLALPAFVKPVKGTMSIRARRVDNASDLEAAVRFTWRDRIRGHLLMLPFQQLLREHTDGRVPAHYFIAEEPLSGEQVTVDGFVQGGEVTIMGVVDSVMYPGTNNFERFEYPSRLPLAVQKRLAELVRRVITASELDHSCFNVELFYDETKDALFIIEINPRMSYQFGDLYDRVDGTHTFSLQLALAVGEPAGWRAGRGADRAAASFVMRRFSDAKVLSAPSAAELERITQRFPGAGIKLLAQEGDRLSDYLQDVGSYRYCIVNLGAPSAALLHEQYREVRAMLKWRFEPEEASLDARAAEETRRAG